MQKRGISFPFFYANTKMYKLKKVSEIVIITADLKQMLDLFCNYGGWTHIFTKKILKSVLISWGISEKSTAKEALIQFMDIDFGRIRFVEIKGITQKIMRPTSKLWDTGGIYDIDIRTHDISEIFDEMINRNWLAAAVPMTLPITAFEIDESVLTNADSMTIALAKRHSPSLELPEGKKFASNIYLSAMTVKNLAMGTDFFVNKLGFQLVNDNLKVKFPPNSSNNFGVPHNFSDKFEIALSIYSPDGTRDTMVECIETVGLLGNDYSAKCEAPNRGILCYRIEVENIIGYLNFVKNNGVSEKKPLSIQLWHGIGQVKTFTVCSPDGAWVMFFEKMK